MRQTCSTTTFTDLMDEMRVCSQSLKNNPDNFSVSWTTDDYIEMGLSFKIIINGDVDNSLVHLSQKRVPT